MEFTIENNFLVPIVYAGSVWLACMSYSQLNKAMSSRNSSPILLGLNIGVTISSFAFLAALTNAMLKQKN